MIEWLLRDRTGLRSFFDCSIVIGQMVVKSTESGVIICLLGSIAMYARWRWPEGGFLILSRGFVFKLSTMLATVVSLRRGQIRSSNEFDCQALPPISSMTRFIMTSCFTGCSTPGTWLPLACGSRDRQCFYQQKRWLHLQNGGKFDARS